MSVRYLKLPQRCQSYAYQPNPQATELTVKRLFYTNSATFNVCTMRHAHIRMKVSLPEETGVTKSEYVYS